MARDRRRPMSPEQALERAATRRAGAPGSTAEQVRQLEDRYGRDGARERLGVSERTMRRYRAGGTPSKRNSGRLERQVSMSPRREARLRNRGAFVHMVATLSGGTPGARRTNRRQRSIGGKDETSIHLTGDQMAEILDAYKAGDDEAALDELRQALADEYGFPALSFEDITALEFLRDDPNGGE